MFASIRSLPRVMTFAAAASLVVVLFPSACVDSDAPTDIGNPNPSAPVAFAKGGAGPDAEYPTTLVISDSASGTPLLVRSDGKGVYTQTRYITNKFNQSSTGYSTWQVTLYSGPRFNPTDRTIFFSLSEPVSNSNPPPPFVESYSTAHVIAKCLQDQVNLLALQVGATAQCAWMTRFQAANGKWYKLAGNPNNFPEVNRMKLTCLSSDSIGCKSWRATTTGTTLTGSDPNYKGIQKLVEIDPSGAELADLGDYYISFAFVISR